MEISVGTYSSVRYLVEVRYWECPLIESPLYSQLRIPPTDTHGAVTGLLLPLSSIAALLLHGRLSID